MPPYVRILTTIPRPLSRVWLLGGVALDHHPLHGAQVLHRIVSASTEEVVEADVLGIKPVVDGAVCGIRDVPLVAEPGHLTRGLGDRVEASEFRARRNSPEHRRSERGGLPGRGNGELA